MPQHFTAIENMPDAVATVMDRITDGIFALDNEWRFTYVNAAAAAAFRYPAEALVGGHIWTIFPEAVGTDFDRYYRQAGATGEVTEFASYYEPYQIWMQVRVYPSPSGITVYMTDITARKAIEEAREESLQRLRLAMDTAELAEWEIDLRSGLVIPSPRLYAMFNLLPHADTTFRDEWRAMLHEEDKPRVKEIVDRCTVDGGDCHFEYRIRRPDGTVRWIESRGTTLRDVQGRITRLVGIAADITERKRTEAALRESEARYRTLLDHTMDWEYLRDPDGNFVYVSPAVARITGYTVDEWLADPTILERIINQEDWEAIRHHDDGIWNAEEARTVDYRITHRNGQIRWINHICRPIYDHSGRFLGRRGNNRDITERKQAELAQMESEAQYRLLFEAANDAIVLHRLSTDPAVSRFQRFNQMACRMLRYTADEMAHLSPLDIQSPADLETVSSEAQIMCEDGTLLFEKTLVCKDGHHFPAEIHSTVFTHMGEPTVLSLIRDVSERKQAEAALRASEARFRATFANAGLAIVLTDQHGHLVETNVACQTIFGYSADELRIMRFAELTHPDDVQENLVYFHQLLAGERDSYQMEKRYFHKDGHLIWARLTVSCLRMPDGAPTTIIAVIDDITERM